MRQQAFRLSFCAKGIERTSGKLVTEVFDEAAPRLRASDPVGAVFRARRGPGPAYGRHHRRPPPIALRLQASLSQATFRPYASDDVLGVALGGAAKNVYAIACGIVDGLGLGESARAALLARASPN